MAFTYKLELEDGTPTDLPALDVAVPTWRSGDMIPLGREKSLRVLDTRSARERTRTLCSWSRPPRRRAPNG
jgi:hypothetical protein